jgi:site-specific recombinase XerD
MRISEAFDLYLRDSIRFRNQSRKTEEHHNDTRKSLIKFVNDLDMVELTFDVVREWKYGMERRNLATATIRGYLIKLRCVLLYLERTHDYLKAEQVPLPKKIESVPEFITKADVAMLITTVSKPNPGYSMLNRYRNAAIISLLYASGIRVSELCAINRGDIHENSFTVIGKGKKPRLCFTDERSIALLNKYSARRGDNHQAMFISAQNGRRINPGGVQEVFRGARVKAGFNKPIHPHTLRHTFATEMLKANTNLRYLQVMLGHESIATTQVYSHVVDLDLQKIYLEHHSV